MNRQWMGVAACFAVALMLLATGPVSAQKPATGEKQGTTSSGTSGGSTGGTTTGGATDGSSGGTTTPCGTTVPTLQELMASLLELLKLIVLWWFGMHGNPDPSALPMSSPGG